MEEGQTTGNGLSELYHFELRQRVEVEVVEERTMRVVVSDHPHLETGGVAYEEMTPLGVNARKYSVYMMWRCTYVRMMWRCMYV